MTSDLTLLVHVGLTSLVHVDFACVCWASISLGTDPKQRNVDDKKQRQFDLLY